jgi:para-nitrobenzyl esterase
MRIRIILTATLLLTSCVGLQFTQLKSAVVDDALITTSSGAVQGYSSVLADDVVQWTDIPYAQPPIGDLRWRAPKEISRPGHLIQPREATYCVQKASDFAGVSGEGIVGSEDCLYLDVRAPTDFRDKSYPVMFWIHGGGNTSGLKDYFDFSKLIAATGVVVVTTNYRLGALGWFSHPAIQGSQQGLDGAANFGTLDIIHSLKWVQKNITAFGGDPDNVTIFGESAGGHNVFALLASPLSKGLFHRAISQSGYTTSYSLEDGFNAQGQNKLIKRGSWQILQSLMHSGELSPSDSSPAEFLRSIDARLLVGEYYKNESDDNIPLTMRDGIVIPDVGLLSALGQKEYRKDVPVMAGATKDEVALWHGLHRYFMDTSYWFTKLLPPVIRVKDADLFDLWVRVRSHAWKLRGVDQPLLAMEEAGYGELYAFRFDWDHQKASFFADFPTILGAAHGTDIAFVTGDYKYGPVTPYIYPEGPNRDQMEASVMRAWSDFAKGLGPGDRLDVDWRPFSREAQHYVHLDRDDALRLDSESETMVTLLDTLKEHKVATDLEKCLIVWESLVNVGDADVASFKHWNNGFCGQFDIVQEQSKLNQALIDEFGSTSVL